MILLSKAFLLGFLPITVIFYWLILKKPKAKLWGLLIFSFVFYSFAGWQFTLLLISLSFATYLFGQKGWFWPGIILNIISLIFFKYWDFGVIVLRRILGNVEWSLLFPILHLALPLGISFYVFKHIGYLLDIKNNRYPASTNLLGFLSYSAFFPQISAGPISNYDDTGQQLINLPEKFDRSKVYNGLVYLAIGLLKKLVLANGITMILDLAFYIPGQGSILLFWAISLLRGIYIYMDFSGYTDIALGIAYLFGIKLPENFDNPFLAENPSSFWKRWHISLSVWFRVYVFSPLSRYFLRSWKGKFRGFTQYAANWITMILVGLWHGASFQYLIWGFYHGTLLNIHAWASRKKFAWVGTWIDKTVTLIAILFSWQLFFTNWTMLKLSMKDMFGFNGFGSIGNLFSSIPIAYFPVLLVAVLITFSGFSEAKKYIKIKSSFFAISIAVILAVLITMIGEPINFDYVQF